VYIEKPLGDNAGKCGSCAHHIVCRFKKMFEEALKEVEELGGKYNEGLSPISINAECRSFMKDERPKGNGYFSRDINK
jgi:hypothetical protein